MRTPLSQVEPGRRRPGRRIAIPSDPGGKPANIHTSSAHASICRTDGGSGVQDARNSTCEPSPCSAKEPKPRDTVFVAVPDTEW